MAGEALYFLSDADGRRKMYEALVGPDVYDPLPYSWEPENFTEDQIYTLAGVAFYNMVARPLVQAGINEKIMKKEGIPIPPKENPEKFFLDLGKEHLGPSLPQEWAAIGDEEAQHIVAGENPFEGWYDPERHAHFTKRKAESHPGYRTVKFILGLGEAAHLDHVFNAIGWVVQDLSSEPKWQTKRRELLKEDALAGIRGADPRKGEELNRYTQGYIDAMNKHIGAAQEGKFKVPNVRESQEALRKLEKAALRRTTSKRKGPLLGPPDPETPMADWAYDEGHLPWIDYATRHFGGLSGKQHRKIRGKHAEALGAAEATHDLSRRHFIDWAKLEDAKRNLSTGKITPEQFQKKLKHVLGEPEGQHPEAKKTAEKAYLGESPTSEAE